LGAALPAANLRLRRTAAMLRQEARPMLMVPPRTSIPTYVRARGGVRLVVGSAQRGSSPLEVAESGGYRVRFPKVGGLCEGVLINTGGGMAGGDRMAVEARLLAQAQATLTTQAAEKIYGSEGVETEIAVRLMLAPGSRLDWLPQEQILFDDARLRRTLQADVAEDAALTLVESVIFGRLAMGEAFRTGAFRDRWRLRRGGRLIFAEDVPLDGLVDETLARQAIGAGARALATLLHVAACAEARRDEARAALEGARSECGVSAWNGMLVARFLSPDPQALRADLVRFLERFRGAPMPRSWQS
jgi:urease accessory protein